jgi:hypothetical protein
MTTSGHDSPRFRFINLANNGEEDSKPSIQQDIVQLDLISGSKMSTSGHNSPHFRFNNLDNDREEDRKPSIHQDIVQLDLISGPKMSTSGITHLTSGSTISTMTVNRTANQVSARK